jgi:hypothetical protein
MTNAVFSTVDRLTSRFRLVDNLINTVATHFLLSYEAKGSSCPPGTTYGGWSCGDYCRPTGDLHFERMNVCNFSSGGGYVYVLECCDCCD